MNVTISVVTALFNKRPYVAETVRSIQAQSIDNWELIIVDDGSTDGGVETVREFRDPRIRLVRSEGRGPGAARNRGIRRATGEWIQFLDADDLLEADHIERQLAAASRHGDADVVACEWQEFRDGEPNRRITKKPTGLGASLDKLRDSAIAFAPWAVHAAIVRRSVFSEQFLWPEELDRLLAEDIAFWFKLIRNHRVAYGSSSGALYRRMTQNCRTDLTPKKWFRGVHAAVSLNVRYLRNDGSRPSAGQCESLMRLYSGIHQLAAKGNAMEIQKQSLAEARHWLAEYFKNNGTPRRTVALRRILGLRLFLALSRCLHARQTGEVIP